MWWKTDIVTSLHWFFLISFFHPSPLSVKDKFFQACDIFTLVTTWSQKPRRLCLLKMIMYISLTDFNTSLYLWPSAVWIYWIGQKLHSGLPIISYRKTWMNFSTYPIFIGYVLIHYLWKILNHSFFKCFPLHSLSLLILKLQLNIFYTDMGQYLLGTLFF